MVQQREVSPVKTAGSLCEEISVQQHLPRAQMQWWTAPLRNRGTFLGWDFTLLIGTNGLTMRLFHQHRRQRLACLIHLLVSLLHIAANPAEMNFSGMLQGAKICTLHRCGKCHRDGTVCCNAAGSDAPTCGAYHRITGRNAARR